MDISGGKNNCYTKELYDRSVKSENSNKNQSQINIEEQFSMLISNCDQEPINILLIQDILKNIRNYYICLYNSANFDAIFKWQDTENRFIIISILISFISDQDKMIKMLSFSIILILISLNKDIADIFIGYDLLDSFILEETDQFDLNVTKYISDILFSIFSYQNDELFQSFLDSNFFVFLIRSLTDSSSKILSDEENLFILDSFLKTNNGFIANGIPEKKEITYEINFDQFVISVIKHFYHFCKNPNEEKDDEILAILMNYLTNKKCLTYLLSECLMYMMPFCHNIHIKSTENGLINLLNEKLEYDEYEIAWPYIIGVDISVLKRFLNDNQDELIAQIFESLNPMLLFNLINKTIDTSENKKVEYQQNFFTQVLRCFIILLDFNSEVILDNENESESITLDQFYSIISISNQFKGDINFLLSQEMVCFIFKAINTQDCFNDNIDIIDQIINENYDLIFQVLETASDSLKVLVLNVLIKLSRRILANDVQNESIISFLQRNDINQLIDDWKNDKDEEIISLSNEFCDNIDQFS